MRLKFLSSLRRHEFFGIDIGLSSVKTVQLRKDKQGYSVISAALEEIAERDISPENIQRENIISVIRRCVRETGIKTNLAVCSVGGPEVNVRRFNFPSLSQEEIENAVLFEAGQVFPFELEHSTVDYTTMKPDSREQRNDLIITPPVGEKERPHHHKK